MWRTMNGHGLVYIHKKKEMDDVQQECDARRDGMIDRKLRISGGMGKIRVPPDRHLPQSDAGRPTRRSRATNAHDALQLANTGGLVSVGNGRPADVR